MADVKEFLKKNEILEVKSVVRGMPLEPEDNVLFQQTTAPRVIKFRLKTDKPDNIIYFVTDYHKAEIPDEMIEMFYDLLDYFNDVNFQHKLILSLVFIEKEKSVVGTLISGINEFMSFKISFNRQIPELLIMNTYYTTEQMGLLLQDFIEEYKDLVPNKVDYNILSLMSVTQPTGEVQPAIQLRIPVGTKKSSSKKQDSGESYTYF